MMLDDFKSLRGKMVAATWILVLLGLLVLAATNIVTARSHALACLNDQIKA
jgi:hypothetical protein